jgi:hypothetical protein
VALRYVDADAGVAARAGVAAIALLTVGADVSRATLALVSILHRVYNCDLLFQQSPSSVSGDETVGPEGRFLKIHVFWDVTLCHWARIPDV